MDANPELLPIGRIAEKIGLSEDHLDPYGCYTAKINRLPPADAPWQWKIDSRYRDHVDQRARWSSTPTLQTAKD
jgi:hypothetical protein